MSEATQLLDLTELVDLIAAMVGTRNWCVVSPDGQVFAGQLIPITMQLQDLCAVMDKGADDVEH